MLTNQVLPADISLNKSISRLCPSPEYFVCNRRNGARTVSSPTPTRTHFPRLKSGVVTFDKHQLRLETLSCLATATLGTGKLDMSGAVVKAIKLVRGLGHLVSRPPNP